MNSNFSKWLNHEIENAAAVVIDGHKKWPIVSARVRIPSGVHYADEPILLRSGVQIEGDSQSSTLIISRLGEEEALFYCDPDQEYYAVKLRELHIRSSVKFHSKAISLHNANRNCVLENLFIENFKIGIETRDCFTACLRDANIYMCETGILASNMTNGRIRDVKVENCAKHGIEVTNLSERTTTGLLLDGVVSQGNGYAGIIVDSIDQALFSSCFLEGNNRKATRRPECEEHDFAQLVISASRTKLNRRNGNIVFDSIFITPGHSKMEKTTAIKLMAGENIVFRGGTVRNFSGKIDCVFYAEDGVNSISISDMTLERVSEVQFLQCADNVSVRLVSNYTSDGATNRYVRLMDRFDIVDSRQIDQ